MATTLETTTTGRPGSTGPADASPAARRWLILPVLFFFLVLQVFLWAVGHAGQSASPPGDGPPTGEREDGAPPPTEP